MSDTSHPTGRFEEAYEAHADGIFAYCKGKLHHAAEAEDTMQETFLRTWEYLCEGNTVTDLKSFLYKVAENLVTDFQRKKKSVSLNELQEQGFDPGQETIGSVQQSLDVEKVLLSSEKKNEHRLLVMRYVHGLRPVDIAAQTGLTPNTVSVRLHRAMQRLTDKISRAGRNVY